jgi:imidazole glycerol-phosphate synthase subunit HisF
LLARRIIPCLDVKAGRVVKGVRFVELRDQGDPVEAATRYDAEGADEVTFLDITASSDARSILLDVVERTAAVLRVPLTVGGGVRALEDCRALLSAGADKVAVNTAAVDDPTLIARIADAYGCQALVVAIDARRTERDGYDLELLGAVSAAVPVPVVASGGVGRLEHFHEGLTTGGADAALAASVFHEGTYTVGAVKEYLAGRGVPVRPPDPR